ncbi:MAG TPA: hypothetical protein VJJ24_01155 [Candidatus Paceibacterota bacterium]
MTDTAKFKKLLIEEKTELLAELGEVGIKEPGDPTEWEPKAAGNDGSNADPNEVADRLEDYGERSGVEVTLEQRLGHVNRALEHIEKGVFGTCEVGGTTHDIEPERLEANPAALTCLSHLDEKI